jgi:N-acetylmuramoyl-L-alanine amidase
MRRIDFIILHCTATPQSTKIDSIKNYWKNVLGWKNVGYHYIIEANGNIVKLAEESQVTNGVQGYNSNAIHVSYIGGVDKNNKPLDNRTPEQINSMVALLKGFRIKYPDVKFRGHNNFTNKKACPSFDAVKWCNENGLKTL